MIESLLLNSALLEMRIPVLAFNCSYASSVLNKILESLTVCGIRLHLWIRLTFCGTHLHLRIPKLLVFSACCGIRDTTNVPKKFTLDSYVRGIHGSFVSGIHLDFGTWIRFFGIQEHKDSKWCAYLVHSLAS